MPTGQTARQRGQSPNEIQRGVAFDYETIADKIAEVDLCQAVMANYRERLQTAGLSAIN